MSQSIGPYTDRYGLVFGYDMSETANCYKGEPTVNLSYNNGQGGSEYLGAPISWVNAGSWSYNDNETDVPKPSIPGVDTTNLRIISGISTARDGSVHFGCGFTYLNPSTTYTASVWYRQSRAGVSQPYLRTNITNVGLGNLAYNGNTDSNTWPVNQWIRISASGLTAPNEDGLYISNYFGQYFNDKIWYFGHQIEQNNHMTPLVVGTRGATQGLIDITNNKTINISTVSFNSSANIIYDGTNDYASLNSPVLSAGQSVYTIEAVFKPYSTKTQVVWEQNSAGVTQNQRACMILLSNGYGGFNGQANDYHSIIPYTPNTWYHWVIVVSKNDVSYPIKLYNNGSLYSQGTPSNGGNNLNVGTYGSAIGYKLNANDEYFHGEIPVVRVYNKALTAAEVLRNYNNYKKRYNI